MIISINYIYWLAGALLLATALLICRDRTHPRRFLAAFFWADLGLLFIVGDQMPAVVIGSQVVALSAVAACGGLRRSSPKALPAGFREAQASMIKSKLLVPALLIPICTLGGSMLLGTVRIGSKYLIDPLNANLCAFGVGCVIALGCGCWFTKGSLSQAVSQSRHMTDSIGWALLLPQMLAMLGGMFQHAGVGQATAYLVNHYIPTGQAWEAVAAYCAGMFLFSVIMGGAGAALPLMLGGIGAPVLVSVFHGKAAEIAALGMFSGYAGVLTTPMAAHFNLIPPALLDLPDKYAVIRAQLPTALAIFVVNGALLYWLM